MRFIPVCAVLMLLLASSALADSSGLILSPTRLTISSGQNTAEAAVTNPTDKPMRYTITLADQMMTASGTTQRVDTFPYSAKGMLKYMPKVVELQPRKRQVVRLLVTRPQGLPSGDYHTHMIFTQVPMPTQPSSTTEDKPGFNVEIGMTYAMGIPIVVQAGQITSSLVLENARIERDAQGNATAVKATFRRTGNAEAVLRIQGEGPDYRAISPMLVRLYRELDVREVTLPLKPDAKAKNPTSITIGLYKEGQNKPVETRVIQ